MARSSFAFSVLFFLLTGCVFLCGCAATAFGAERAYFRSTQVEERITFAFAKTLSDLDSLLQPWDLQTLPSEHYLKSARLRPGAIVVVPDAPNEGGIDRALLPDGGLSAGDELDDYDDYEGGDLKVSDPFEGWNRFWFRFNDKFYLYVADPVYRGWQWVTPEILRVGLKNFFHNALFPVRFVNNLLQLKFKAAGVEFSRFMLNTMSSAGFCNPAAQKKALFSVDPIGEDFGQTLGVWGLGHGPYIVWPFIGPCSLRDTFGRIGDLFADPFFYLQPWWLSTSTVLTLRFNDLDEVLPLYRELKGAALDPYIAMREAYIQYRNQHVAQ